MNPAPESGAEVRCPKCGSAEHVRVSDFHWKWFCYLCQCCVDPATPEPASEAVRKEEWEFVARDEFGHSSFRNSRGQTMGVVAYIDTLKKEMELYRSELLAISETYCGCNFDDPNQVQGGFSEGLVYAFVEGAILKEEARADQLRADVLRLERERDEARNEWGPQIQKLLDSLGPVLLEREDLRQRLRKIKELSLRVPWHDAEGHPSREIARLAQ